MEGKIVTSTSLIEIKNLNEKKRPISAVVDNFEVRNIKKVIIKINNSINFKLLYDKNFLAFSKNKMLNGYLLLKKLII